MKLKEIHSGHVVAGTVNGHPFIKGGSNRPGSAVVQFPVIQKGIARMTNRGSNAAKSAIKAANAKGAV